MPTEHPPGPDALDGPTAPRSPGPARAGVGTDGASAASRLQLSLGQVAEQRRARAADPALARRTEALKAYQRRRMETSYADLLGDRRHARAMRFLIDECHGGREGGHRGRRMGQLAQIVPTLAAGFPSDLVEAVAEFAGFQALSESLDTALARQLSSDVLTPRRHLAAWRAARQGDGRRQQVSLMLAIGRRLDRVTRDPFLGVGLRMMRGPALFTGLGSLQQFLEHGLDAFAAMRGADQLLAEIEARESAFIVALDAGIPPEPAAPVRRS